MVTPFLVYMQLLDPFGFRFFW